METFTTISGEKQRVSHQDRRHRLCFAPGQGRKQTATEKKETGLQV